MVIPVVRNWQPPGKAPDPWKMAYVGLNRGDPTFDSYDRQPPEIRLQWDALEDFLIHLSRNRHLYMAGCFGYSADTVEQFVCRKHRRYWVGSCKVTQRADLHALLAANPLEWYYFIVTETALSDQVAARLIDMAQIGNFYEHVIDLCVDPFCMIEENNDRDSFDLACRDEHMEDILRDLAQILGRYGIGLSERGKRSGDTR